MAKAARDADIPRTTARRRAKAGHTSESGHVSEKKGGEPASPAKRVDHSTGMEVKQVGVRFSVVEFEQLVKYRQKTKSGSYSDTVRQIIRDFFKENPQ